MLRYQFDWTIDPHIRWNVYNCHNRPVTEDNGTGQWYVSITFIVNHVKAIDSDDGNDREWR